MNPVLRRSSAHVFVSSLASPSLSYDDEHHLDRVLRVEPTDTISVSDGARSWAAATWSRSRGITLTGEVHTEAPRQELTVVCAIPKGDRSELVAQKLTEVGIDRILFFETMNSVVHWDAERRKRQSERLGRIARESAMQSRRLTLPEIGFCTFEQAIGLPGVAIAEPGAAGTIDSSINTVLVGPEGGFDVEELGYAVASVRLSGNVLRVETAAIVAGVALVTAHR
ncbi:MAG: hypothetical protein FD127_4061 [Acidimicrobiaceae bacterium]|nr:MAG: hypothetical protein FD127_4061 [Acidimicrobiaceae bacterium]